MPRLVHWGVFVGLIVVAASAGAEERQAPRGYLYFTPRSRPSATARSRVAEFTRSEETREKSDRAKTSYRQTNYSAPSHSETAADPPPLHPQPMPQPGPQPAEKVSWGTIYGRGYSYPGYTWGSGVYYNTREYGVPIDWPMTGYRYTYEHCGRRYSAHCYTSRGYGSACGPRYDCGYRPCWNDCGPTVFECKRRRGSWLDGAWLMGGWDFSCKDSCCTYPCPPITYCWPTEVPGTRATPSQGVSTNFYEYNLEAVMPGPDPRLIPRDRPATSQPVPQRVVPKAPAPQVDGPAIETPAEEPTPKPEV